MSLTTNASDVPNRSLRTREELEWIVQWLAEPSNWSRLKEVSGLTKTAAPAPVARQFTSKTVGRVFDKYANIKRAHSKAAQLNDQS